MAFAKLPPSDQKAGKEAEGEALDDSPAENASCATMACSLLPPEPRMPSMTMCEQDWILRGVLAVGECDS
jgi:hypothetical protein